MSFCTACGSDVSGTRFCTSCGQPVAAPGEPAATASIPPPPAVVESHGAANPRTGGRRWLPVTVAVLVVLVLALGGAMIWILNSKNTPTPSAQPLPAASPVRTAKPTPTPVVTKTVVPPVVVTQTVVPPVVATQVVADFTGTWSGSQTNVGDGSTMAVTMRLSQGAGGSVNGSVSWRTNSGRYAEYQTTGSVGDGQTLHLDGIGGWTVDPGIPQATLDSYDLNLSGSQLAGRVEGVYGSDGGNWGQATLYRTG